ncbi:MAG TPA: o-succinylbenzoate--CoA ligase, partial [bacterium]
PGAVPALLARVGCRRLVAADGAAVPATGGIDPLDARMFWSAGAETQSPGGYGDEPRASGARDSGAIPPFIPDAPATIVFTSGSTGAPKAALHSFANHWASAVGSNRNIPLRPGDRWLLSLPLWHVGGLAVIFRCLQGGAAVVLADRDQPLADAILVRGITHVSLVATQLFRLLGDARGREALRSLKAALLGGGPVAAPLLDEAARLGARLVTSYGSTETASQAAATRPGDPPEALRTAGRPLPFREIALDAGGEILVRGRTLFAGYLEGGEVRAARDRGGWFHTGDLGHLDAAGRLVVDGRRDNMFVSGGENIHPEEIERALVDFPGTLDAIVVPVPDAEFGARPAAFLRTASGHLPDPAALGAFLRRTLPGFKAPVRYLPWPDVAEGMKPDRRELARLATPGNAPLPLWQRGEGGISRS